MPDVDLIPEPEVKAEPRSLYGNRSPYQVLGKSYAVLDDPSIYDEVGLASYYGNKFHGRRTSNLEVYDMYAFTAAHKTLPLPSFARVTNLANGRSVVVRVNDRGPFHDGRIIDLSYAAAVKLGVDRMGTARVEVKGLGPGEAVDALATQPAASHAVAPAAVASTAVAMPARTADSAIDHLVAVLPIAGASAAEHAPQPTTRMPNPAGERFDMLQDGRTMTADEFDRWMRARQLHVATGTAKTMPASPRAPAAPVPTTPVPATPAPATTIPATPTQVVARSSEPADAAALTFQVASFAARANAEHALAMLAGAGIDGARLLDADANGRRVWRLRVGPVAASRRRNSSRASRVWVSANRSACASKLACFPLFPFPVMDGRLPESVVDERSVQADACQARPPPRRARRSCSALDRVVGIALAQAPALPQTGRRRKPAALSDALPIPPAPAPKRRPPGS